ncbi:hypothetical protein K440DRAFT_660669 [Wilcoxina mikolae CBS 423.85]|nr:hypothetical protein K440DRAFT_660669 [Wilcoxina mikolae CBS 423.85]
MNNTFGLARARARLEAPPSSKKTMDEAKTFAKNENVMFFETSARNNIEDLFIAIAVRLRSETVCREPLEDTALFVGISYYDAPLLRDRMKVSPIPSSKVLDQNTQIMSFYQNNSFWQQKTSYASRLLEATITKASLWGNFKYPAVKAEVEIDLELGFESVLLPVVHKFPDSKPATGCVVHDVAWNIGPRMALKSQVEGALTESLGSPVYGNTQNLFSPSQLPPRPLSQSESIPEVRLDDKIIDGIPGINHPSLNPNGVRVAISREERVRRERLAALKAAREYLDQPGEYAFI